MSLFDLLRDHPVPAVSWPALAAVGLAFAAFLLLAGRFLQLRLETRHLRKALRACWEGYLDALAVSVERLKLLQRALSQVRPSPTQTDLAETCDHCREIVRSEIAEIEKQLDELAAAPDRKWYAAPPNWRSTLDLQRDIENLVRLANRSGSDEEMGNDLTRLRAEHKRAMEAQKEIEKDLEKERTAHEESRARLVDSQNRLEIAEQALEVEKAKFEREIRALEENPRDLQDRLDRSEALVAQLRQDLAAQVKAFDTERAKLKATLEEARQQGKQKETQVAVAEKEAAALQNAYDELNARFLEAKTAREQAEQSRKQTEEEAGKVRQGLQQLTARYAEIRKEFAALMQEHDRPALPGAASSRKAASPNASAPAPPHESSSD